MLQPPGALKVVLVLAEAKEVVAVAQALVAEELLGRAAMLQPPGAKVVLVTAEVEEVAVRP